MLPRVRRAVERNAFAVVDAKFDAQQVVGGGRVSPWITKLLAITTSRNTVRNERMN